MAGYDDRFLVNDNWLAPAEFLDRGRDLVDRGLRNLTRIAGIGMGLSTGHCSTCIACSSPPGARTGGARVMLRVRYQIAKVLVIHPAPRALGTQHQRR